METEDLIGFDAESYKAGGTGWAAPSASEIAEDIKGNGEYREILPEPVTHDTARAIIEKSVLPGVLSSMQAMESVSEGPMRCLCVWWRNWEFRWQRERTV